MIDNLIKYIPKGKQNKKRLKLLLQIYPNGNSETKKLHKIIKESKEKMNQREKELSSQKNDEKQRKKIIIFKIKVNMVNFKCKILCMYISINFSLHDKF